MRVLDDIVKLVPVLAEDDDDDDDMVRKRYDVFMCVYCSPAKSFWFFSFLILVFALGKPYL